MFVQITGTGSYLPERVVTNDELAATLDTSDEWIYYILASAAVISVRMTKAPLRWQSRRRAPPWPRLVWHRRIWG